MITGLLEKDPLGAFKQINEMYIKYIQSAFKTRYKQIEDQRMQLLKQNGNAYQDPYIEILPEYKESELGKIREWNYDSFQECFEDEHQFKTFIRLITSGLIESDIIPYTHQVNMLKKGILTEIHYPIPPNKQKAMSGILDKEATPISEEIHSTTLSLPISYYHTEEDVLKVIETINQF